MKRRVFITLLGGAAAWPIDMAAQQPTMPVVGFLSVGSAADSGHLASAFRQGLSDGGFFEGRSVTIEYGWAKGQFDQVSALAADLLRKRVSLIATGGTTVSLATKAVTTTVPIVFVSGADAVDVGLVNSLNRPDANLTGVNLFSNVVTAKRVQLLHELVRSSAPLAMMANPAVMKAAQREISDVEKAAAALGRSLQVLHVSSDREIEAAFATIVRQQIGGLVVQVEPFLTSRYKHLVLLTAQHAVPTISGIREFPLAGGLMSYGPDLTAAWRVVGAYAARILRGERPADLPVLQPTKFELVINVKTANALALTVPATFFARADEVIE